MSQTILPPSEPSSLGQAPWTSLCFRPASRPDRDPGAPGLASPDTELRIHTGKGSKETSTPLQHHLLQQAPKATGTSQAAWGPTPPSLAALSSSPTHRMQCLMLLPSREREGRKKCHLVNDKLFQSHSSDTKGPGPRTARASSLWVGGRQLSTSGGAIAQSQAPRSPCTSGQTTVPHPSGQTPPASSNNSGQLPSWPST